VDEIELIRKAGEEKIKDHFGSWICTGRYCQGGKRAIIGSGNRIL